MSKAVLAMEYSTGSPTSQFYLSWPLQKSPQYLKFIHFGMSKALFFKAACCFIVENICFSSCVPTHWRTTALHYQNVILLTNLHATYLWTNNTIQHSSQPCQDELFPTLHLLIRNTQTRNINVKIRWVYFCQWKKCESYLESSDQKSRWLCFIRMANYHCMNLHVAGIRDI